LTVGKGSYRGRGDLYRDAQHKVGDAAFMSDDQAKRSDLQDFGDKLAKARGAEEAKLRPARRSGASAGDGLRVAIEFVVSVLVGSGLGYTIGSFLGSPVVGLLLGMPIGFAAGLRTVYRSMTATPPAAEGEDE
jgi:F0F1-type ATP synthase assembly protein I